MEKVFLPSQPDAWIEIDKSNINIEDVIDKISGSLNINNNKMLSFVTRAISNWNLTNDDGKKAKISIDNVRLLPIKDFFLYLK